MTCPPSREGDDCLNIKFTATTPHFFKIIFHHNILDGKLRIPKKFTSKYGDGLPSHVLLKVPSSAEWQVELRNYDGEVWLQNGWKEFLEHYSLRHGHFVVFRYEGNGHFHVVIFDMTASEIEYPHTCGHGKDHNFTEEPNMGEAADDTSVEILDNILPSRRLRDKSPLPCSRPCKMVKICSPCSLPEFGEGELNRAKKGGGGMSISKRQPQTKVFRTRSLQPLADDEKAKALQKASAFKSQNPSFVVSMKPSYINPGYKITIPSSFAMNYLKKKLGDVILCVSDGKTWPAKYHFSGVNTKLTNGWRGFVMDNKLEIGDVCIFELIKGTDISLNVIIHRGCCPSLADVTRANRSKCQRNPQKSKSNVDSHYSTKEFKGSGRMSLAHRCSKSKVVGVEKSIALQRTCAFKSKNPSFMVPNKSGANQVLPNRTLVPKTESDCTGNTKAGTATADQFTNQELELPRHNFKVEHCPSRQLRCKKRSGVKDSLRPLETARNFVSKYPFFEAVVRSSHLKHCCMTIPVWFLKNHIKQSEQSVTLQAAGRSWLVKLLSYQHQRKVILSAGWSAFARGNSLQAGDVCVFELIKNSNIVLNVSRFQCAS